ncbi:gala protein [Actinoplanes sp. L3-i22]|uniref:gala protein n=1 Tax=Actinoplanes sp. L3-i22 TaxID=2836373 RepID=UPI00210508A2|nr:gala protein [Actinoplanes sp. L3-i22]
MPIRCPAIQNPEAGLAPATDFDPLVAWLTDTPAATPGPLPAPGPLSGAGPSTLPAPGPLSGAGPSGLSEDQISPYGVPPAPAVFPRGAMQPDGRLDLCKQGIGPVEVGRIAAAAAGSPHVRHLLLGTNALGSEGVRAVAGALRPGHGIETLYLGCNRIGPDGVAILADRLAGDDTVRALWLKRNPVGDEGVARLAGALGGTANLRTLDLVNTGITATGLTTLTDALVAGGPRLQRLFLGGNGFGPEVVPVLARLIHEAGVRELYLAVNHLGDEGAAALASVAAGVPMTLGLGGNGLTAAGAAALARHCAAWQVLDLARPPSQQALGGSPNELGDAGAAEFAAALPGARLRRLDLRLTGIRGRGARLLVDAIASGHPTLEYLGINGGVPRRQRRRAGDLLSERTPTAPHPDIRAIASIYR